MTFEEYLNKQGIKDMFLKMYQMSTILNYAQDWHTQELKSMRSKGANTTNTKYSKEQRSEWARRGTKARLQNKLNK